MFKTKLHTLLEEVKEEIKSKLLTINFESLKSSLKSDNSIVTEMDIYISNLFKSKLTSVDSKINFYSEEHQDSFKFPVAILDPIDGTKEFAKGLDECVVSFGIYYSSRLDDERNFSWIYNFHTGFEISSDTPLIKPKQSRVEKVEGLVSKTEFNNEMYSKKEKIRAVGSIAYKLALLASKQCEFVITRKPKNVWDILAGTHICQKQGIEFYQNTQKVDFLIKDELYLPEMLWCKSSNLEAIKFHI